jgi:hypothetical protein
MPTDPDVRLMLGVPATEQDRDTEHIFDTAIRRPLGHDDPDPHSWLLTAFTISINHVPASISMSGFPHRSQVSHVYPSSPLT